MTSLMRLAVCAVLVAAMVGAPSATSLVPNDAVGQSPPNVVMIMVDDATVEDMAYMPNVQSLLVDQGTTFTHNYSPYPLCCPARATMLTGQYPHNHRVLDNVAPIGGASVFDDSSTIATYISDDYDTAMVGKYMNDFDTRRYVPPGWDTWKVAVGKGVYNYRHQTMSLNGTLRDFDTFMTHQHGKQTRSFIGQASGPFFALTTFVAPHKGQPLDKANDPATPYVLPKYRNTYAGPPLPQDPSFNEADASDKRPRVADQPLLTARQITTIEDKLAQRREALRSVDDEVGLIVRQVETMGAMDNTYFVFTSDNGFMQGQHRITTGKSAAYEPAARVPLVIRGPGVPIGATYDEVTGLQDLTPTILSMTQQWGDQQMAQIDGVSLLKLLAGKATTRVQVLETVTGAELSDTQVAAGATPSPTVARRISSISWDMRGIVTSDGWKYTAYPQSGHYEMYDLNVDPYEEQNVYGVPGYEVQQARLETLYRQYKSCDGEECR